MSQNAYSMTEVVEYLMVQGANGFWYTKACRVIGHRKFINRQEVNDDGTPKSKQQPFPPASRV